MSDDAAPDTGAAKTPADFLKSIRGKPVVVKLNSGVDYRGILACLDGYMNIAMEQTEVRSSSRSRVTRSTRASRSNDASKAPSGRARAPIADAPPNPKISRQSRVSLRRRVRVFRVSPPTSRRIGRVAHRTPRPAPSQTSRSQEYVNGQLKNKYGDAFIRGNNVLYISTAKDR